MSERFTHAPTLAEGEHAAVMNLLAAAKYLKDAEDGECFAEVWASDATLTIDSNGRQIGPIVGRAAIMAFYRESWRRGEHGTGGARETHVAEHPFITATSDSRLRAIHSAMFAAVAGEEPVLIGFATFTDDIEFEDGRWRIRARTSSIRRRADRV